MEKIFAFSLQNDITMRMKATLQILLKESFQLFKPNF